MQELPTFSIIDDEEILLLLEVVANMSLKQEPRKEAKVIICDLRESNPNLSVDLLISELKRNPSLTDFAFRCAR